MRKYLIGTAAAAIISIVGFGVATAAPAPATGDVVPQATINADYTYISTNVSRNINDFGGGGSGIVPVGGGFSLQGDASYHYLTTSGVNLNDYAVSGGIAWQNTMGRVGATVAYSGFDSNNSGAHVNLNFVSYGAYGEWYASDAFTVGLKAGGAMASGGGGGFGFGSSTLGYVGAQVVGYATPDFAVSGGVDYMGDSSGNLTSASVMAEWLLSHDIPVSIYAGYRYDDLEGLHANSGLVGIKYYFGGGGSLQEHERTGVDNWGTTAVASHVTF